MKQATLILEHRHNGRTLKKLQLSSKGRPMVFGNSPKADMRLPGSEVSPFHACVENRNGEWVVFDFASTTGTWVNGESIVEFKMSQPTVFKIGLHEIYCQPVEPVRDLFNQRESGDVGGFAYHQVVVRTEKGVLETHLLNSDQHYVLNLGKEVKRFKPPQSGEWVSSKEGRYLIQQRLVADPGQVGLPPAKLEPEMKWPFLVTSVSILILALIVLLKPGGPDEMKDLPELQSQRFASIIYDAKKMAEKRKESREMVEKRKPASAAKGAAGGATAQEVSKGNSGTPNRKLISQVKSSELSSLIGKIAKRASSHTMLIGAVGQTPDKQGTGRAIAGATGLAAATVGQPGVAQGSGFKLSGVGTGGKGGGGNYKEGTGLGLGGVGTSQVGILEEESEVSGGLDRDIIAEVIKSELGQIRYCYERQLSGNPDLYGKVMIRFTIGSEGLVVEQKIGQTTLKSADVEGCILRRVARWKFPTPKGGTNVLVTYPFLFKSADRGVAGQ